jgi:hypothetical protein
MPTRALPPIFLYLGPLLAAAFVLSLFLKEIPLRGGRTTEGQSAPASRAA